MFKLLNENKSKTPKEMFLLGGMYYTGEGVEKDYKKALHWYEKPAQQGDAEAQAVLAGMYYEGKGVSKNHRKALHWCEESAQQGYAHAQYNLSIMMYKNRNYIQAYKWATLVESQVISEDKQKEKLDKLLNDLEGRMTRGEIVKARKLASQMKIPKYIMKKVHWPVSFKINNTYQE